MFHTEELIVTTFGMVLVLSVIFVLGFISIIIMLKGRTQTIHTFKPYAVEIPHYVNKKLINLSVLKGDKYIKNGIVLNLNELILVNKSKTKDMNVNAEILSGYDKDVEETLRLNLGGQFMMNVLPSLLLEYFKADYDSSTALLVQDSGKFPLVIFFDPECKISHPLDAIQIENRLYSEQITIVAIINGFQHRPMK